MKTLRISPMIPGRAVSYLLCFVMVWVTRPEAQRELAPPLTIGWKAFQEQELLCEVLRQYLSSRVKGTVRCTDEPTRAPLTPHTDLVDGKIDLYVEYTGTAFVEALNRPVNQARELAPDAITTILKDGYSAMGLLWLDELGYDSDFVMVVRKTDASRLGGNTLSNARKRAWRIGSGPHFQARSDGLNGLLQTYRLELRGRPVTADVDALLRLLQARGVDMIAANRVDPRIDAAGILEDDLRCFPKYRAAIVLRKAAATRYPSLAKALAGLKGAITLEDMLAMLEQLQNGRDRPTAASVAARFVARLDARLPR